MLLLRIFSQISGLVKLPASQLKNGPQFVLIENNFALSTIDDKRERGVSLLISSNEPIDFPPHERSKNTQIKPRAFDAFMYSK
ncbi:unnamed protein product [Trichogramma brassicae]|uniref:Uncharacterized protein n=1 Tax=Trichogramma brassicae TaxID=86971 RepID=A0A6H5IKC1_9HYME|nr:unnamed protein product [Trichogramma brassicae]